MPSCKQQRGRRVTFPVHSTRRDIMKSFRLRAIPFALLFATLAAPLAAGAATTDPAKPVFKTCKPDSKAGKGVCRNLPPLPGAVGNVTSLLPLDVITGAASSALVRGAEHDSLCYHGTNWKGTSETVCKPVPYSRAVSGYAIMKVVGGGGTPTYVFRLRPGMKVGSNALVAAQRYLTALSATSEALQKIADKRLAISTTPTTGAMLHTTPRTTANLGADEGCGHDDDGGEFCAERGDHDYGNPYGGNGNGNGGGNAGPASEIPVVVVPGQRPLPSAPPPLYPSGGGDPVSDGQLEDASGEGKGDAMWFCLPGPGGVPMCSRVQTVVVTGASARAMMDSFFAWLHSIPVLVRDTTGIGDDDSAGRDDKRAVCLAGWKVAAKLCNDARVDTGDSAPITDTMALQMCYAAAKNAFATCMADNP